MRDAKTLSAFIVKWIRETVSAAHAEGAVVGLSGGIDSAVAAALLKEALGEENVLTVLMPCDSLPEDGEHATLTAKALGLKMETVDLSAVYKTYRDTIDAVQEPSHLAAANIKPRLRMISLYTIAQTLGYLVCGTDNKDELTIGYFTKFGDGACDFLPLADLTKAEVRAVALEMGVPEIVVNKPPSAGLWQGQTDEQEIGVTYDDLDAYVSGQPVAQKAFERIRVLEKRSAHKRSMPPRCIIG